MKFVMLAVSAIGLLGLSHNTIADGGGDGGCQFDAKPEGGLFATCAKEQEKKEVILTGELSFEDLRVQPDFDDNLASYQPDPDAIAKLAALDKDTEIVLIVATWCPDCHRETPRFAKIIQLADNSNIRTRFIAVDRSRSDPQGLAAGYDWQRIPTFMVFQNGQEIGRIVERPETTQEQDLVNILGL